MVDKNKKIVIYRQLWILFKQDQQSLLFEKDITDYQQ